MKVISTFKGWHSRMTRFYVALCLDCGSPGADPLPIPFLDLRDADTWYSVHTKATGHQVERITEIRVDP